MGAVLGAWHIGDVGLPPARMLRKGISELESGELLESGRVRRSGGGRKPLTETDPTLLCDLERLVEQDT